jgi:hypothetical protein
MHENSKHKEVTRCRWVAFESSRKQVNLSATVPSPGTEPIGVTVGARLP